MIVPNITTVTKHGREGHDIFSNEYLKYRKINLIGDVDDAMATSIISQLEHLDREGTKDIIMYINSPGGSVTAGLAIMDAMNRVKSDVVTVCTGMAASMGAFLMTCGKKGKRHITPHANMMIHQPLGGARGQASDIVLTAQRILKLKEMLNQMLSEKTGRDIETITKDTDRDYYLDAQEAVDYGLVDSILKTNIVV